MDKLSFEDQRALVTGAGKGIGREDALELARRGAAVVVNDRNRADADAVVAEIAAAGGKAVACYEAVGTKEAGQRIIAHAVERLGGLEILINNAGFIRPAYLEDTSEEHMTSMLDVHLTGPLYLTQAAWPILRKQRYGRVLMTSSGTGMLGHQGQVNYAAAKAGVFGMMKTLSYEGYPHGILVNAVLPYAQTTIGTIDMIPGMAEEYPKYLTPDLAAKLAHRPRGPDAIAPMAVYLVSRECNVTGEAYSIASGRYGRVFVGVTDGWLNLANEPVTAEAIRAHLAEIRDLSRHTTPKWLYEEQAGVAKRL